MNIEKLAIERKSFEDNYWYRLANSNVPRELLFRVFSDAEHKKGEYINREIQNCWESWLASKALQQDEPVGYFVSCDDSKKPNGRFYGFRDNFTQAQALAEALNKFENVHISKAFTHPPATVLLKKYNKLLEDYRCLRDDTLFTAIKMGISAGMRQAQDECLGNSNIHYADETLILEHCWAIEAKRKQAIAEAEGINKCQ